MQLHDKALDEEHRFFDFTLKSVYWLCTSCIFHIKDVMEHKCREILVLCISCLQGRFLDFFNGVAGTGGARSSQEGGPWEKSCAPSQVG